MSEYYSCDFLISEGIPETFSILGLVKVDSVGKEQTLLDVRDDTGREVMSLSLDKQLVFKLAETPETVNIVRLNQTLAGHG